MNIKHLFLSLLFFAGVSLGFDTTCFQQSYTFTPSGVFTHVITTSPTMFAIQQGVIVPMKSLPYTSEQSYLGYSISVSSGFADAEVTRIADSDPDTSIAFSSGEKSITLTFDTPLKAGKFTPFFDISDGGYTIFSFSHDGKNFTPVFLDQLTDFSFSHLRIDFMDTIDDVTKKVIFSPTKIHDILFSRPTDNSFLIQNTVGIPVTLFTKSICPISSEIKDQNQANEGVKFMTNSDTPQIRPVFTSHAAYERDRDRDSVSNADDNCLLTANKDQKDTDGDRIGDVCDLNPRSRDARLGDTDQDGVDDVRDNCVSVKNPRQEDSDADGDGDACRDDDHDGIQGFRDNCPTVANADQRDIDINGVGDVCESDRDGDGVFDTVDVCPRIANPSQKDLDYDGIGDVCDNCEYYNADQRDENGDGRGDACVEREQYQKIHDDDGDGVTNNIDSCEKIANPLVPRIDISTQKTVMWQPDTDLDGVGDACDNCPVLQNTDQKDINKNSIGDLCEDIDGDGLQSYLDNCPQDANADQMDKNNDEIGDVCDDTDGDDIRASIDNCPYVYNPDQLDSDEDVRGDSCDTEDDRFIEKNKTFFIILFSLIGLGLIVAVVWIGRKLF